MVAGFILFAVGVFVFKSYEYFFKTIPDLYAQEWVAGMVIRHMDLNDGSWPRNWDELSKDFEIATVTAGRPWTFEELRSRVNVDFSADPNELAKTALENGCAPFRVVALRSGNTHHWENGEPNLRIWSYLQQRADSSEK